MNEAKPAIKDPICGMIVDEKTALRAEKAGKSFFFCSESCQKKFLSSSSNVKVEEKSGGCCS